MGLHYKNFCGMLVGPKQKKSVGGEKKDNVHCLVSFFKWGVEVDK